MQNKLALTHTNKYRITHPVTMLQSLDAEKVFFILVIWLQSLKSRMRINEHLSPPLSWKDGVIKVEHSALISVNYL